MYLHFPPSLLSLWRIFLVATVICWGLTMCAIGSCPLFISLWTIPPAMTFSKGSYCYTNFWMVCRTKSVSNRSINLDGSGWEGKKMKNTLKASDAAAHPKPTELIQVQQQMTDLSAQVAALTTQQTVNRKWKLSGESRPERCLICNKIGHLQYKYLSH